MGPMPERKSSFGVSRAPADRMTSLLAESIEKSIAVL